MKEFVCRRMCYDFGRRWRVGDVAVVNGGFSHPHFIELPKRFTPREALIEANVISRDDHLGKTKRIQVADELIAVGVGADRRGEPERATTMRELADAQGMGGEPTRRGPGRPRKTAPAESS